MFATWFEQPKEHRLPFEWNVIQTVANYYEPVVRAVVNRAVVNRAVVNRAVVNRAVVNRAVVNRAVMFGGQHGSNV